MSHRLNDLNVEFLIETLKKRGAGDSGDSGRLYAVICRGKNAEAADILYQQSPDTSQCQEPARDIGALFFDA